MYLHDPGQQLWCPTVHEWLWLCAGNRSASAAMVVQPISQIPERLMFSFITSRTSPAPPSFMNSTLTGSLPARDFKTNKRLRTKPFAKK